MVKKLPHDSEYFGRARSVISQPEFKELLDAKMDYHKRAQGMTKDQSAGYYNKFGGYADKFNQTAEATFGKKWRKLGYANVHRIIDGAANETLDEAIQKYDFNNFKTGLKNSRLSDPGKNNSKFDDRLWKGLNHDGQTHVQAYIEKRASKLIEDFWKKKSSGEIPAGKFEAVSKAYCQKMAKQVGLPESEVTYYFLRDWYFNGDD